MIDPIPVEEELERIRREQALLQKRGNGALALSWFSEHALSKTSGGPRVPISGGVLPDSVAVVASGTSNADKVKRYVDQAFREHHRAIIQRAIKLAEADFEAKA